jgi:cytochrome c-type biogenesis protein CcmH/NrfG
VNRDELRRYSRARRRRRHRHRRRGFRIWLRRSLLAGAAVLAVFGAGYALYHALPEPDAAHYLEEALALQAEGKLNAAITPLKAALQQAPDNTEVRWLLAEIYLAQGHGSAALDQLMQLQELGRSCRNSVARGAMSATG